MDEGAKPIRVQIGVLELILVCKVNRGNSQQGISLETNRSGTH